MPPPAEKQGRALSWMLLIAAVAVGAAAGGYGVHLFDRDHAPPPRDDEPEPSVVVDKVVALGRIEPKDGVLSLGLTTPDRVACIKVKAGDRVEKGQLLAILDSEVLRRMEQSLAVKQRAEAEKRLQAVTASGNAQVRVEEVRRDRIEQLQPIEIKSLRSKIKYLQAQEENAQRDYQRYVAAGDTIAPQDKEKQRLLRNQVQAELIAAQCQLEKSLKSRELNRRLAEAQLEAAKAELNRARSAISLESLDRQIDEAGERLKETQLRAPSDGKILRVLVHEGELVRGQAIVRMADTRRMIVLTEVYETEIESVHIGAKATIHSHIFKDGDALSGHVFWKGASVGKARLIDLDPRAAVDNRVVDVKVEVDKPESVADLIGHQVRVEIATEPRPRGSGEKR